MFAKILSDTCLPAQYHIVGLFNYLNCHPEIQSRVGRRELQAGAEKFLEGRFDASILAGI